MQGPALGNVAPGTRRRAWPGYPILPKPEVKPEAKAEAKPAAGGPETWSAGSSR